MSVVIPVAVGDESWKDLLSDLNALCEDDEIILSSPTSLSDELVLIAKQNHVKCPYRWTLSRPGRAQQLNTGAELATKDFVWFLHCDSKISALSIEKLKISVLRFPKEIHYFDLFFLDDGPSWMIANQYGVWVRSHLLGLPFGDQGFCLHRDLFEELHGFCERATYGEDHLFVWRARQNRIKVRSVGVPIYTSARRYQTKGWAVTTVRHLSLTIRQAAPEFLRLLRKRIRI